MRYFLYSITVVLALLIMPASYAQNCSPDLQLAAFRSAVSEVVSSEPEQHAGSKFFEYDKPEEIERIRNVSSMLPQEADTVFAFHPNGDDDTLVNLIAFSKGCAIGGIQMSWDRFQLLDIYVTGKTPA